MDCICGYDWDEDNDRRNTTGTRKREEPRRAPARPISRIPYRHLLRSVFRITYSVYHTRNGPFKKAIRNERFFFKYMFVFSTGILEICLFINGFYLQLNDNFFIII